MFIFICKLNSTLFILVSLLYKDLPQSQRVVLWSKERKGGGMCSPHGVTRTISCDCDLPCLSTVSPQSQKIATGGFHQVPVGLSTRTNHRRSESPASTMSTISSTSVAIVDKSLESKKVEEVPFPGKGGRSDSSPFYSVYYRFL